MKKTILVITNSNDSGVDEVISILGNFGEKVYRVNTELFPWKLAATLQNGNIQPVSSLIGAEPATDIKSVWCRHPGTPLAGCANSFGGYEKFIQEEAKSALWSLWTIMPAFWVNHPFFAVRLLENNKFYQLACAKKNGLAIPNTIITNRQDDLLKFCEENKGEIAVKLLSGHLFSSEQDDKPKVVYTQMISYNWLKNHQEEICLAPVFAQEYVPKYVELRVTIIWDQIFSCAIHSQDSERTKHDWRRYDFEKVKHEIHHLPEDIKCNLIKMMRELKLAYSAVDMILTPKGEYIFLEVNPSGQWGWIEELTGLPITKAIADMLANPPAGTFPLI